MRTCPQADPAGGKTSEPQFMVLPAPDLEAVFGFRGCPQGNGDRDSKGHQLALAIRATVSIFCGGRGFR